MLQRIEGDVTRLAEEKVALETSKIKALEGSQAARKELEETEARLRTLKGQADEIEAAQEPTRLALEAERAEIQSIRRERESFEALKREIVVQGNRAIESAEKCRAEQMTLALIKRDKIKQASQLYINHLEAAMEFASSPEFLCSLRALLQTHFTHVGVTTDMGPEAPPAPAPQPVEPPPKSKHPEFLDAGEEADGGLIKAYK